MIELRWRRATSHPSSLEVESNALVMNGNNYVVLQSRQVGSYTTVTVDGVTQGLTDFIYEWKDVEIEQ